MMKPNTGGAAITMYKRGQALKSVEDLHLHLLPPAGAVHTADRLGTVAAAAALDDKVVILMYPVHLVAVLRK